MLTSCMSSSSLLYLIMLTSFQTSSPLLYLPGWIPQRLALLLLIHHFGLLVDKLFSSLLTTQTCWKTSSSFLLTMLNSFKTRSSFLYLPCWPPVRLALLFLTYYADFLWNKFFSSLLNMLTICKTLLYSPCRSACIHVNL